MTVESTPSMSQSHLHYMDMGHFLEIDMDANEDPFEVGAFSSDVHYFGFLYAYLTSIIYHVSECCHSSESCHSTEKPI